MRVAAADRSRHAHGPSGPDDDARVDPRGSGECGRDHDDAVLVHSPASDGVPKDEQRERLTGSACPRRGGVLPFPTVFVLPPLLGGDRQRSAP